MAKKAMAIMLTSEEQKALNKMVKSRVTGQGMSMRAQIVLLAAQGKENGEIEKALDVNKNTVTLWRQRFHRDRLEGLKDQAGRGRKKKYGHDERLKIIAKSCERPEKAKRWTVRDLSKELSGLGVSKSTVNRILQETDLKPHRVEYWLTSKDPEFEKKAAEVCGLYLNPPENALVISVDEKTGIQALGRKFPDKPERPGSPRKREFEYKRNGTVSLFAGFMVHKGQVIAGVKERHRREEFIEFLEKINEECPKDKMIHVIVDNLAVHKTEEVKEWLKKHQRFEFHFTPTHASWLNQVELWFSILSRRFLNDGIFDSKDQLVKELMGYITEYNKEAKPFKWTYKGVPLCI